MTSLLALVAQLVHPCPIGRLRLEVPGGRVVVDGGGSTESSGHNPGGAGGAKAGNPWREGWRSLFLLGVTVALVLLGLAFRHAAATGKEDPRLENHSPQIIGVYSTDPHVTVHLTAEIFWRTLSRTPEREPDEFVSVSVSGSKAKKSSAILVTSNVRPGSTERSPDGKLMFRPDTRYSKAVMINGTSPFKVFDNSEYIAEIPFSDIERNSHAGQSFIVGEFELPQITQQSHGSFFVHLPVIGFNYGFHSTLPKLINETPSYFQHQKLLIDPQLKDTRNPPLTGYASSDPSEYLAPSDQSKLYETYWQPVSLTTKETLVGVQAELQNSTVNNIEPPDGHLQDNNYVWEGKGYLEPTMNVVNQDAAASHGQWDFRSGIAFGVAAGTGVAFVQEENNPLLNLVGRFSRWFWAKVRRLRIRKKKA
jgi:hypothetical protein